MSDIINRNIYAKDLAALKLENQGVAIVNYSELDARAMEVLRFELETFVCSGQYASGLERILQAFLGNHDKPQQPGVWVSGFYGSGKSHLVKMLRALWVDTRFPDGKTARSIAKLPPEVNCKFIELQSLGLRHDGLHAASGTLGSGIGGSVRLSVMGIVFLSAGLPEHFHLARFVMWLRQKGYERKVRERVESDGLNWDDELDNFLVADALHNALFKVARSDFNSPRSCGEILNKQYPIMSDVSSEDFVKNIRRALTKGHADSSSAVKIPFTLLALDEVQQHIGDSTERAHEVQEVVEACSKGFGGRLMLLGTGQTALTGTSNFKKLEGRFPVRVELSDEDVDDVVRKVVLEKRPEAVPHVQSVMERNIGEISRHLSGTSLNDHQDDAKHFVEDYPILPVRRRLWELALRILDKTSSDSQLRNQLGMTLKAARTNLDQPLGNVIPADFMFFDSAAKLLQSGVLPKELLDKISRWSKKPRDADEHLMSRVCAIVFLIDKINASKDETGLAATPDTIADLLLEDLQAGSGELRKAIPRVAGDCELLMKVGGEYRIQTKEGLAWNDEYQAYINKLANERHLVDAERAQRMKEVLSSMILKIPYRQGATRVPRELRPYFEATPPSESSNRAVVWVRDGWSSTFGDVRNEAFRAGPDSPTIFVYLAKRSPDALFRHFSEFMAAKAVLEQYGVPASEAGKDARLAMETRKRRSDAEIARLFDEVFSTAVVLRGGGTKIDGEDFKSMIRNAADSSFKRLFRFFDLGDKIGWDKAYEKAKTGEPGALLRVGHEGPPAANPVLKAILDFLQRAKKGDATRKTRGREIQAHFAASPYGWSADCVDGAIQVLLAERLVQCESENGGPVGAKELDRKSIAKCCFQGERAPLSAQEILKLKSLFKLAGLAVKAIFDPSQIEDFIRRLDSLKNSAGGEPPKPKVPSCGLLERIKSAEGDEWLDIIANNMENLERHIKEWKDAANRISDCWPHWERLIGALDAAKDAPGAADVLARADSIKSDRALIIKKSTIMALNDELSAILRAGQGEIGWEPGYAPDAGGSPQGLGVAPKAQEGESGAHKAHPLRAPMGREDSGGHFAAGAAHAPKARLVELPSPPAFFETEDEVDGWIEAARAILKKALRDGPVSLRRSAPRKER